LVLPRLSLGGYGFVDAHPGLYDFAGGGNENNQNVVSPAAFS